MLSFTDQQLEMLKTATSMLPPEPADVRNNFLRSIGNRLTDLPYPPSDADIMHAINFVLSCRGVGGGIQAFNNGNNNEQVARRAVRAAAERYFHPCRSSA